MKNKIILKIKLIQLSTNKKCKSIKEMKIITSISKHKS